MKKLKQLSLLTMIASLLVVAGCGSSNNSATTAQDDSVEVQVDAGLTGFRKFIQEQFDATADNTDAINVDELNLSFVGEDDETAFDSLLAL